MKVSRTFSIEQEVLAKVIAYCKKRSVSLNMFVEHALLEKLSSEKKESG